MSAHSERSYHGTFPSSIAGFIGLVFGLLAAGGMYYYQHSIEIAVATFVIVGYTAGLWFHLTSNAYQLNEHYRMLKTLPINNAPRRVKRLVLDFGFWWSLIFGVVVIGAGAWYGGQRHFRTLTWIEICWAGITLLLNYEVTVLEPTTRCRSCGYQLLGLLNPEDTQQVVRCPECGTKWSKSDLCLVPIFKQTPSTNSSAQSINNHSSTTDGHASHSHQAASATNSSQPHGGTATSASSSGRELTHAA